jgi:flagellar assembly factor FliW
MLFGALEVQPGRLVHFADGLFGFRACTQFALVPTPRSDSFWLQSVDQPSLAFLLVDPFRVAPGFSVEIGDADLAAIDAASPGEVAVLAIVTLPRTAGESPTANLQGPLAINVRTALGRQVAVASSAFGTRCAFAMRPAD